MASATISRAEQLKELLAGSIDVVRRRLLDVVKPERQAAIKQAMTEISGATDAVEGGRDFEPAQRTVLALHRAGELGEGALLEFRQGFQIRGVDRRAFGDDRA